MSLTKSKGINREEPLESQLKACMQADFFRLSRQLRQLNKTPDQKRHTALQKAVDQSIANRDLRRHSVPDLSFPEELPVSSRRDEIAKAIQAHQIILICGETGSGKTTQLPKICPNLGELSGFT